MAQAGIVVGRRVTDLSAKDRARLTRLLRQSRGWPGRLAPKQRAELRKLLGKLDPKALSRELLPLVRGGGRRKRRSWSAPPAPVARGGGRPRDRGPRPALDAGAARPGGSAGRAASRCALLLVAAGADP